MTRAARRPDAVLKVGGSLCQSPGVLRRLMTTLTLLARSRTLVVVPGGGRFADEARRADRRFALDPSSSHWMAILGMDQTAYLLCAVANRARLVRRPEEVEAGRLNVLAPSEWLLRQDPLPHSWRVTSDSIAAWVAAALGARRLVLLKSIDGVAETGPARRDRGRPSRGPKRAGILARATGRQLGGVVDGHFGRVLPAGICCWIASGAHPARVARLLRTGSTYGTEVISRAAPTPSPAAARSERASASTRSRLTRPATRSPAHAAPRTPTMSG